MEIDKTEEVLLNEEGEEEEKPEEKPEDAPGDDAGGSEEGGEGEQPSEDSKAGTDAEAEAAVEDADKPFAGLDLRKALCFGYSYPKTNGWKFLADQSEDAGWQNIDVKQLENSLTKNVDQCYYKIAQFLLVNVDDDMPYSLWYDNNKALWNIEIANSPEAELTAEERKDFFGSEMFKKISKRTYYMLLDAVKSYNTNVKWHVDNGDLLLVDAVKLDAILHFLDTDYFMKNILNGKYIGF